MKKIANYVIIGIVVSTNRKDNKLLLLIEVDYKKVSDEDFQKLKLDYSVGKRTTDVKKYQEELEKEGLTCKNS